MDIKIKSFNNATTILNNNNSKIPNIDDEVNKWLKEHNIKVIEIKVNSGIVVNAGFYKAYKDITILYEEKE